MTICSAGSEIELYLGRDNAVTVVPYSDLAQGVNYDMTTTTRVTAEADLVDDTIPSNAILADSAVDPAKVYWDDNSIGDDGQPEWRIYCKVGLFTGMVSGIYTLRITIYDTANPNGLVLPGTGTDLIVSVLDLP